ncbi:MAG: RIP metalloprotease RseP [Pseudomonadota bacterium]|nr:RIP metalloprotease RseP [Pseudomonadota bacterium]
MFCQYGHFWVGRRNGVRVSTFSIGFGPELFGWTDAHQTRWRVSLIPLGGYVKFFGDQDVSSTTVDKSLENTLSDAEKATMLHNKTPLQRIAVAVAGPAANYLFAIIVLTALIAMKGMPTAPAVIGTIKADSFAEKIGLKLNDKIIRFGNHDIKKFDDCVKALSEFSGKDTNITIERAGTKIDFQAKLYSEENGQRKPIKLLGIGSGGEPNYEKTSIINAFVKSVHYCYSMSVKILQMLGTMITGNAGGDVGGLISIGKMAKESWNGGISALVMFMAMLSINLGLINLLPVPMLDGGHILLCSIEAIRGRPLPEKIQERIFMVGVALVLSLMVYSNVADIVREKSWFMGVFSSIGSLFGIK